MLMNQAIPLSKKGSLANIIDWPTYKARLIEEFGSIDIFGRDITGSLNTSLATSPYRKLLKTWLLRSRPCRQTWRW